MTWFTDWWYALTGRNEIDALNARIKQDMNAMDRLNQTIADLSVKVVNLNDLVYQLQKTDDGKAQKIVELQTQVTQLQARVQDDLGAIESLKTALALYGETITPVPDYLNEGLPTYPPVRTIPQPNENNPTSGFFLSTYQINDPTNMFVFFPFQREIIYQKNWRSLPSKHKKLMALWTWMSDLNVRRYVSDVGDNWQFAVDTLYRRLGDCEDSGILFVTFARALGVLSNEVYLCVGPTSFGYHAYPIVWYSPDDAKEAFNDATKSGWYIYESTANWTPTNPGPLKGSQYWIDRGIMNWQHAGLIRPAYMEQFNGSSSGAPGALSFQEERKIDNSQEKMDAIRKHWVEELKLGK